MPVPELDRILIYLLFATPPPTNILAILMNLCCLFCLYLFLRSIHIICLLLSFRATSRALAFPIPGWQPWSMREMVIAKLRHNTTRRERYIFFGMYCAPVSRLVSDLDKTYRLLSDRVTYLVMKTMLLYQQKSAWNNNHCRCPVTCVLKLLSAVQLLKFGNG